LYSFCLEGTLTRSFYDVIYASDYSFSDADRRVTN
jgi:hypothetical protein